MDSVFVPVVDERVDDKNCSPWTIAFSRNYSLLSISKGPSLHLPFPFDQDFSPIAVSHVLLEQRSNVDRKGIWIVRYVVTLCADIDIPINRRNRSVISNFLPRKILGPAT